MTTNGSGRVLVIGDIHGCVDALNALIDCVKPTANDTLIFLGDYVDHGPDSSAVLDRMIELKADHNIVTLHGNHDLFGF